MKKILFIISLFLLLSCKTTPTIFLIGDSTMSDKQEKDMPEKGWGQVLPEFFSNQIHIVNCAKNGRSSRSFIYEGRWDSVYADLKKGDFVVIQFGHNDDVITKTGRHTTHEEYRYNLSKYVRETREKGANPILCTPIQRRHFDSTGVLTDTHGKYPEIVREVAHEMDVPLVDMQAKSDSVIRKLGDEESKKLFMHVEPGLYPKYPNGRIDNTHFIERGAKTMSVLFIEGLKENDHELCTYLKIN
jgi:lysophospholipase L1-like esterase